MPLTAAERKQAAQKAARARWSKTTDRAAATAPARAALEQRFVDQVDPDRVLPEDVRAELVANARHAYYVGVAAKRMATQARKRAARADEAM